MLYTDMFGRIKAFLPKSQQLLKGRRWSKIPQQERTIYLAARIAASQSRDLLSKTQSVLCLTQCPMLRDPADYLEWRKYIMTLLKDAGVESTILPNATKVPADDTRARTLIQQHVSVELSPILNNADAASDAWEQLADWFKLHRASVVQTRKSELDWMRIERYCSAQSFNEAFLDAVRDLRALGEDVPIRNLVIRYIAAVGHKYPMWAARMKLEARYSQDFYSDAKLLELMSEILHGGDMLF